jgi:sarcosine oxidase gamma subunit
MNMKTLIASGLLIAGMLVGVSTASAHHSFAAEFDSKQPVKLEGVVTKVEWTNPHVWIYLNVKGEDGKVTNWGAELGPPHGLQRRGWRRTTLEIGTKITVEGSLAKNGSSRLNARSVTLAATGGQPGQKLDAASSQNGQDGN